MKIITESSNDAFSKTNSQNIFIYLGNKKLKKNNIEYKEIRKLLNTLLSDSVEITKKNGLQDIVSFKSDPDFFINNISNILSVIDNFQNKHLYLKLIYSITHGTSRLIRPLVSNKSEMYMQFPPQGDQNIIIAGISNPPELLKFATYLNSSGCINCFEPSTKNFKLLKEMDLKSCKLNLYNYALYKENVNHITFADDGDGSKLDEFSEINTKKLSIKAVCIDDFFKNQNFDLIKLNINGSEYDALCGAKKTIKKCNPKIMTLLTKENFFKIPKLLLSINENYKFKLKYFDLDNSLNDIILYAYVEV